MSKEQKAASGDACTELGRYFRPTFWTSALVGPYVQDESDYIGPSMAIYIGPLKTGPKVLKSGPKKLVRKHHAN